MFGVGSGGSDAGRDAGSGRGAVDLTKEGVGAATIHKALAIVSGMFRQAVI